MGAVYFQQQELPDLAIDWPDREGTPVDFSAGHTFTLRLVRDGAVALEKTTGFTGADESPNLVVSWSPGELDDIDPGAYDLVVVAKRTLDDKDRMNHGTLTVRRLVT